MAGEGSQSWMHTVLGLKHIIFEAGIHESFKKGAAEVTVFCVGAKSCGRELPMVADHHNPARLQLHRNERGWLDSLASLVEHKVVDPVHEQID